MKRYKFRVIQSLWNLTGTLAVAVVLLRLLANFRALQLFLNSILQFRAFIRFGNKMSQHLVIKAQMHYFTLCYDENWTYNGIMQYMISMNPATLPTKILNHSSYHLVIFCGNNTRNGCVVLTQLVYCMTLMFLMTNYVKYLEIHYMFHIILSYWYFMRHSCLPRYINWYGSAI